MSMSPIISLLANIPLTGPNFAEWKRYLTYILVAEEHNFVLTTPRPLALTDESTDAEKEEHKRWHKSNNMAKYYMMMTTMSQTLQLQHQVMDDAATIMLNLIEVFGKSERSARFNIMREILACEMSESSSVHKHVMHMINLFDRLDLLGGGIDGEAKVDIILNTLSKTYETSASMLL
ncbi:uncharacterized protein LOC131025774 [Salvia miltiorrhiza]|uniref:uncharacterized protein LOC131025774 n=1 Tax=Salvia miltiorrhiza TaxID=226208 RepID=UPI0025AD814A|nr:uncharacterized protein LOC131025774 [Salvia miltiorrhiza]